MWTRYITALHLLRMVTIYYTKWLNTELGRLLTYAGALHHDLLPSGLGAAKMAQRAAAAGWCVLQCGLQCVLRRMYIYIYLYVNMYIYVYIYIYTCVCVCTCAYAYIYIRIRVIGS